MNDYIKRDDALMAIMALEDRDIPEDRYPDTEFAFNEGLVRAADKVNDIPATDVVKRKSGKWIEHGEPNEYGVYQPRYWTCSNCGAVGYHKFNFCPNCGAEMRREGK